jgi:hypothetical protein
MQALALVGLSCLPISFRRHPSGRLAKKVAIVERARERRRQAGRASALRASPFYGRPRQLASCLPPPAAIVDTGWCAHADWGSISCSIPSASPGSRVCGARRLGRGAGGASGGRRRRSVGRSVDKLRLARRSMVSSPSRSRPRDGHAHAHTHALD